MKRGDEHRGPARRRGPRACAAADLFALAAQEAAAARGRFAVALSGGETPRALYRLLARQQFSQKVPWRRVQLYWGDERCVPPDDPASNYGMAREALHQARAHPRTRTCTACAARTNPAAAALAYEKELRALAALERPRSELPVFDLVAPRPRRRRPHGLALPAQRRARRGGAPLRRDRGARRLGAPHHHLSGDQRGAPRVVPRERRRTRPAWWPRCSRACACPRPCRRRASRRCTARSPGCSTRPPPRSSRRRPLLSRLDWRLPSRRGERAWAGFGTHDDEPDPAAAARLATGGADGASRCSTRTASLCATRPTTSTRSSRRPTSTRLVVT